MFYFLLLELTPGVPQVWLAAQLLWQSFLFGLSVRIPLWKTWIRLPSQGKDGATLSPTFLLFSLLTFNQSTARQRPLYLQREFPQIHAVLVYIHPKAYTDFATQTRLKTVLQLKRITPGALNLKIGDFNHCRPEEALNNVYQHVTCVTHFSKCLYLFVMGP